MKAQLIGWGGAALIALAGTARAEIKILSNRNAGGAATARFKFQDVPPPARNDAAASAKFTLVDGVRDANGGDLGHLHDGRLPGEGDQPSDNFFFNAATDGGRLQIDLGSTIEIKQVNTYSWHTGSRGPQVYVLYAGDGQAEGFQAAPKRGTDPEKCGWKLVARVDTRPAEGAPGGQYGVSISGAGGAIGRFRYLLFEVARTAPTDRFGNTFYSEIDIVDQNGPALAEATAPVGGGDGQPITKSFEADGGKYRFTLNATAAPDLMEWADSQLRPVIQEWYPKLVAMLPSEGFRAPTNITVRFRENMGGTPASAGGGFINCNAGWFRKELKREALGSVVHEMVHVVQSYGGGRRGNPNATRPPGWLVEGIPDYIRWFKYEPQTRGAEITKRNLERARYDASYRVTGNFLNWVTETHDTNIVLKLNTAARQSKDTGEVWKSATGKTVEQLGEEWKKAMAEKIAAAEAPKEKTN